MLSLAVQRYAGPQTQEVATTTLTLPTEEIKGRIIGKEGRNIRTFEKETGVESYKPAKQTTTWLQPRTKVAKLGSEMVRL